MTPVRWTIGLALICAVAIVVMGFITEWAPPELLVGAIGTIPAYVALAFTIFNRADVRDAVREAKRSADANERSARAAERDNELAEIALAHQMTPGETGVAGVLVRSSSGPESTPAIKANLKMVSHGVVHIERVSVESNRAHYFLDAPDSQHLSKSYPRIAHSNDVRWTWSVQPFLNLFPAEHLAIYLYPRSGAPVAIHMGQDQLDSLNAAIDQSLREGKIKR